MNPVEVTITNKGDVNYNVKIVNASPLIIYKPYNYTIMNLVLNQVHVLNNNYAINYAHKMNAKLTYKIKINDRYVRSDGTSLIYIQILYKKKKKQLPLDIAVKSKDFDKKRQRVKSSCNFANDYNLIIEKVLADINTIEINYRLNNEELTLEKFLKDLTQPSLRVSFIAFAEALLKKQLEDKVLRQTTYNAQLGQISVLKQFKSEVLFADITHELIDKIKVYLIKTRKYKKASVNGFFKTFKKVLHEANKKGIKTKISFDQIKVTSMKGEMVFLEAAELKKMHSYYKSEFVPDYFKPILLKYLFCCFTGLRYSDVIKLQPDNVIGDFLAFTALKTNKLQKIKLNETAKALLEDPIFFKSDFTNEYANRRLKEIASTLSINKKLTFHTSRHTFATQYLINGGQIQHLKHLLAHSKIETTMIYVHEVEANINNEIKNMDNIIG